MTIHYLKGDATNPKVPGRKVIAHIVNDAGLWGAGFTKALTQKWPQTEVKYYKWFQGYVGDTKPVLGSTYAYSLKHLNILVPANEMPGYIDPIDDPEALWLFNMCAQHGVGRSSKPIRYVALDECLEQLGDFCKQMKMSVHACRFGTGLAGGSWTKIQPVIEHQLRGTEVYIYEL